MTNALSERLVNILDLSHELIRKQGPDQATSRLSQEILAAVCTKYKASPIYREWVRGFICKHNFSYNLSPDLAETQGAVFTTLTVPVIAL